ncbi:SGNH/GDSL hydrolase family protein [Xanthobacter autotrophicus]|uniref:SGNH/GDSL hydrolase family protein n=1 Tax=Xanthobacter TaxID=279 RepID=UPI0024AB3850|nr:SGNH/GDSL hydrolase family protein [Xanthobacter autotrophicus]MDI4665258.1 SGNH/GDSL hydrolase family protein [Xanthobacter autotrophicus]
MFLTDDPDFAAARQAAQGYNRSTLVLMGDSRLAGFYNDPNTKLMRQGGNFLRYGLALSGQRMRVEKSFAVAGQRSDQYLAAANVTQALACKSHWLVIYGVANDIGTYGGAVDHFTANIKPVADAWTATGRGVILITETGANSYTGNAANMGAVFKYNRQVRDYCRANRGAILFDAAAVVMDPSQPMTVNPAYSGDGLHIGLVAGAYTLGAKFADLIKQIAPPCDGLIYSAGQVIANGGVQLHPNPLWLTTTGGSGSSIMTGIVPAGITSISAPSGSSITGSVTAGAYGNDLQFAITAGAAGVFKIKCDFATEQEIVGETYYANAEFDVAAGASNFQSCGVHLECNRAGTTTQTEDGFVSTANGNLPSGAYSFISETERLTIPSGSRGWFSAWLVFYFSAAGSATVKVRRFGVWRQQG